VHVPAGTTVTVELPIGPDQLSYWNAAKRDWVLDTARYQVGMGGSSSVELTKSFEVR